ncbi:MAG: hypothetical protein Q4D59_10460 [Erysipelotrichaceae bacterium]|nr:hypothetical protein [Erysipelotrichaceae bacterium]
MNKLMKLMFAAGLAFSMAACSASAPEGEKEIVGGWTEAEDGTITDELQAKFDKAMEGFTGVGYTPVKLLETQLVSGTNYKFLCEAQTVVPGAEKREAIVVIYEDLEGNCSILEIQDSQPEEESTSMANPWHTVERIDEAQEAVGFEFSLPVVDLYNGADISYMASDELKIIQVTFQDEGGEICLRKGVGDEDISGDYNDWPDVRELSYGDLTVTVKGSGEDIHTVIWNDSEFSYSITSEGSLNEQAVSALVSSISQTFEF